MQMDKKYKGLHFMVVVVLRWIWMTLSDIFIQFATVELNIMTNIKRQLEPTYVFHYTTWYFNYFLYFVDLLGGAWKLFWVNYN